jgi:hypothetical protein
MPKEIMISSWISVVPTKMYNGWVKKKLIPKGSYMFTSGEEDDTYSYQIRKDYDYKWISNLKELKEYKAKGWKVSKKTYVISEKNMFKIRQEIGKWYNKVFDYIYKWLNENDFIKLKSGSFDTGFCVESDPDREVVKDWGAPLADEGNKVVQVKEKFGSIRVYFTSLTKEERKKIEKFEKHVKKKFDCETYFG